MAVMADVVCDKGVACFWQVLYLLKCFNPLNAELKPICHLLAVLGAHHILHVSRVRVKIQAFLVMTVTADMFCNTGTFFKSSYCWRVL